MWNLSFEDAEEEEDDDDEDVIVENEYDGDDDEEAIENEQQEAQDYDEEYEEEEEEEEVHCVVSSSHFSCVCCLFGIWVNEISLFQLVQINYWFRASKILDFQLALQRGSIHTCLFFHGVTVSFKSNIW